MTIWSATATSAWTVWVPRLVRVALVACLVLAGLHGMPLVTADMDNGQAAAMQLWPQANPMALSEHSTVQAKVTP